MVNENREVFEIPLPGGSIRIGKIFDISIEINFTWFIVFALVTLSLATSYFPQEYAHLTSFTYLILGVVTSFLFFSSVLFHELCHSLVGKWNHMAIKKITLFIFGGVAQLSKEPDSPQVEFKMAIAGPLASFLLALLFAIIWLAAEGLALTIFVAAPALYLFRINIMLAVFNLTPGFPLDGGRVLRAALWYWFDDLTKATRIATRAGETFAFFLIFIGFVGIILTQRLEPAWFILLGWFLQHAAQTSYQHLIFERALARVKIRDIMTTEVQTVSSSLRLDELVNQYFLKYRYGRFPVVDDGRLEGIITLHDIKEISVERWSELTVREVLKPLERKIIIGPEEGASTALNKMAREEIGHLLVIEGDRLVGLVTRSDILRSIRIRAELGV